MVMLIGCDKSSLVTGKLCNVTGSKIPPLCFYFDSAAWNEQSLVNMLGSLLRQLVSGLEKKIQKWQSRVSGSRERVLGVEGYRSLGY